MTGSDSLSVGGRGHLTKLKNEQTDIVSNRSFQPSDLDVGGIIPVLDMR